MLVGAAARAEAQQPAADTGCQTCHRDQQSAALSTPARDFALTDVHRDRGFTLRGLPRRRSAGHRQGGGQGARPRASGESRRGAQVIAVCARCHSDAALMRKYAPKQRIDQATEYATSVHGQQLAKGDTKVATCVSCHGAHGVRLVGDAQSPVYPLNVAATCTKCHADPERMKGYTARRGSPAHRSAREVPDERALTARWWSATICRRRPATTVTATTARRRPGVDAIANVCGTCHTRVRDEVRAQHAQPDLRSRLRRVPQQPRHRAAERRDAGDRQGRTLRTCHSEGDNGHKAATSMRGGIDKLKAAIAHSRSRSSASRTRGSRWATRRSRCARPAIT